jgi:RimJ/RimL family protein N-acetyltransferase
MHNTILLTVMHQRLSDGVDGRYWTARDDGEVAGFAFQSPSRYRAVLSSAGRSVALAMAEVMAAEAPAIPGVMAEAASASAFAGRWAEVRRTPAVPLEAQQLLRLGELVLPGRVPGCLRQATDDDRSLLVAWAEGFLADTGESAALDTQAMVDGRLKAGRIWVWEDDGAVSMASAPPPVAGVCRIGIVYTPPRHRRRGYAGACVAALSAHLLAAGAEVCVLYTQLANPTSNALYRRLGYEPLSEVLLYRFG